MTDTYRSDCHFDGCDARFVAIDRADYVEHIREEHGAFKAELYDRLVVSEPDVADNAIQDAIDRLLARGADRKRELQRMFDEDDGGDDS